MTHDERMLDLAERVADGYTGATDDQLRELADWALLQRRECELERQQRHAAETRLETFEPRWLRVLRSGGALS